MLYKSSFGWYYYHHHHHHHTVSCHIYSLPATSPLQPTAIPNAHGSSFTLKHFPYYVWCSKYSCLLYWIYWMISSFVFLFWSFISLPFFGHTAVVSASKSTSVELNWIIFITFLKPISQYVCILVLFILLSTHSCPFLPQIQLNRTALCKYWGKRSFHKFRFHIIGHMSLPAVCVFQSVACICYSFCLVVLCQHTQTVNSCTELNYCTVIVYRTICIATDCVSINLSAVPHMFTKSHVYTLKTLFCM